MAAVNNPLKILGMLMMIYTLQAEQNTYFIRIIKSCYKILFSSPTFTCVPASI